MESRQFLDYADNKQPMGAEFHIDMGFNELAQLRALFTTTSFQPAYDDTGLVVDVPVREPRILNLFEQIPTDKEQVRYQRENRAGRCS